MSDSYYRDRALEGYPTDSLDETFDPEEVCIAYVDRTAGLVAEEWDDARDIPYFNTFGANREREVRILRNSDALFRLIHWKAGINVPQWWIPAVPRK